MFYVEHKSWINIVVYRNSVLSTGGSLHSYKNKCSFYYQVIKDIINPSIGKQDKVLN